MIAGISIDPKEKEKIASIAVSTGRLPTRQLLYEKLESLKNDELAYLLGIAVALICFDPNKEQQFEKARAGLFDVKIDNFDKSSEALAHVSKLLQDANTAFGKEFVSFYDLFGLVKKKLRKDVRFEIDGLLADGDSENQLDYDWKYIDDAVSKAWLKVSRRPQGYYGGILQLLHPKHPKPTPGSAVIIRSGDWLV